jgi:hypothetical protein
MVSEDKSNCKGFDKLQHSALYREFEAEREEILKHKWIESEKAGYDVGFEWALTDWIIKYRPNWLKWRKEQMAKQAKQDRENPDKT